MLTCRIAVAISKVVDRISVISLPASVTAELVTAGRSAIVALPVTTASRNAAHVRAIRPVAIRRPVSVIIVCATAKGSVTVKYVTDTGARSYNS